MARLNPIKTSLLGVALLGLLAGACSTKKKHHDDGSAQVDAAAAPAAGADSAAPLGDASPGLSSHPAVRYKKLRLLRSDFSNALQLPPDQLCAESGHDCFTNYHVILGSNDLNLTLYKTEEAPSLSTAVAVERIAVQACARRVDRDLAGSPVIFKGVAANATSFTPAMGQAVAALYQSFLQRQPTATEAQALQDLFTGVQQNAPASAGKVWANLACWSVATTLEFVLY